MQVNSLAIELFNLEDCDIKDIQYRKINDSSLLDLFLMERPIPCPDCGCDQPKIKGYEIKSIRHAALTDRKCVLRYHARRYRCPICGRTYYEKNPFVFGAMKISTLTVQNILKDLKEFNETFTSVARRYNISPTSVASIFDSHVSMPRLKLPEYMSWDECYAFHSLSEKSKYVCMFLDYTTGNPVDILPSRQKEYLIKYLRKIPREERMNVKMISTDMYEVYRSVIKELFPHAKQSVDHYHLSQELHRKVDRVRLRIMKHYSMNKGSDEYYLLKNFNWLIYKRADSINKDGSELFDPNNEKQYNKHYKAYKNYYDLKEQMRKIHPDLVTAWDIKDSFVDLYETNTTDTIEQALNEFIQTLMQCSVPEIHEFGKTVKNWRKEIINSFIIVKQTYQVDKDTGHVTVSNHRLNNGLMENRNGILKCIKKNANGYSNWERFRNRCLYVMREDAIYSLYPVTKK